jgi:hypothetical protein
MPKISSKFDNYNLNKALNLLGPRNKSHLSIGITDNLLITIQNFIKTFFRSINFIFGDHHWYNNKKAQEILIKYYTSPESYPQIAKKIDDLYTALEQRGDSFFFTLRELSGFSHVRAARQNFLYPSPNLNQKLQTSELITPITPLPDLQSSSNLNDLICDEDLNVSVNANDDGKDIDDAPTNANDEKDIDDTETNANDEEIDISVSANEEKNTIINEIQEDLNSFIRVQANPRMIYPIGVRHSIAINADEDLYNYQVKLLPKNHVSPEEAKEAYDQLVTSLAPRKVPISETNINNQFDPRYASAYDPYELFAHAIWIAMKKDNWKYINICFSHSNSLSYIKKAIFYLFLQAELKTNACDAHGGEYLNINNNALNETRYQKPMLTYQASADGTYAAKPLFQTDLFSSTHVGCDPVGAKRLMDKLQKSNQLSSFELYYFCQISNSPSQDQIILSDLLTTMAKQVNDRYGQKIITMVRNSTESAFKSAATSLKNINTYNQIMLAADTPYQLFLYTFIMRAQKLASAGLINDEELSNATSLDYIGKIVCSETLLKVLYSATIKDNFTVSLTPKINLSCGTIVAHEPSEENPNILVATEHSIANALNGTGTIDDPSSDLIYLISMISKLSAEDKKLFFKFYSINYLKDLYALKGIPKDKMTDVNKTEEIFNQLPKEKRESFLKLANDLGGPLHILYENYFKKMYGPIWNHLELEENPLPTILKPEKELPVIFQGQIEQEIQFQYLDLEFHSKVILGKHPLSDQPPIKLFNSWNEIGGANNGKKMYNGVLEQNTQSCNKTAYGNCMYGALSLVIFGSNEESNCSQLRKAAAKYMLDHKDIFAFTMIDSLNENVVYQNKGESEKKYSKRIQPILEDLLIKHCESIQRAKFNEWIFGTDREMSAIAAIFGVEIQVFNASKTCKLNPMENGIIQPNSVVGNMYKGKPPIKLLLYELHFGPLTRIIA